MTEDIFTALKDLEKLLATILERLKSFPSEKTILDSISKVEHAHSIVKKVLEALGEGVEEENEFLRRRRQQLGRTKENLFALVSEDIDSFKNFRRHFTEVDALLAQYKISLLKEIDMKKELGADDKSWQLRQLAYLGYVQANEAKREEALHILEAVLGEFFSLSEKYLPFFR